MHQKSLSSLKAYAPRDARIAIRWRGNCPVMDAPGRCKSPDVGDTSENLSGRRRPGPGFDRPDWPPGAEPSAGAARDHLRRRVAARRPSAPASARPPSVAAARACPARRAAPAPPRRTCRLRPLFVPASRTRNLPCVPSTSPSTSVPCSWSTASPCAPSRRASTPSGPPAVARCCASSWPSRLRRARRGPRRAAVGVVRAGAPRRAISGACCFRSGRARALPAAPGIHRGGRRSGSSAACASSIEPVPALTDELAAVIPTRRAGRRDRLQLERGLQYAGVASSRSWRRVVT